MNMPKRGEYSVIMHNGDKYWLLVPKFTGSNPAEVVEFFREKNSSARLPSEGK